MSKLAYYPLYVVTAAFMALIASNRHRAPPQQVWLDLLGDGVASSNISAVGPCATLGVLHDQLQ